MLVKPVLVGGVIIVVGAVALLLAHDRLLIAVGDYLVVRDDLQPASIIHVIAGEDYRTEYALQLYRQGYGAALFFTGGWCQRHQYDHAEHGKALALAAGLPSTAVAGDSAAVHSTYDEAIRLKAYVEQSPAPIRSVIVVSDPFHMRRARWTYHLIFSDQVKILMAPVPFEQTPYVRAWWTDAATWLYVRNEYLKIAYYHARYQLSSGPLRDWLATLDRD